jgi:chromosomal replication initiator protein
MTTKPKIQTIMVATARYYEMTVDQMIERNRKADIAKARHVAMYLARKHTDRSLKTIGRSFGNMDHATVIHAERKIKKKLLRFAPLIREVGEIESLLQLNSTTG